MGVRVYAHVAWTDGWAEIYAQCPRSQVRPPLTLFGGLVSLQLLIAPSCRGKGGGRCVEWTRIEHPHSRSYPSQYRMGSMKVPFTLCHGSRRVFSSHIYPST